jgi:hypothetical protein
MSDAAQANERDESKAGLAEAQEEWRASVMALPRRFTMVPRPDSAVPDRQGLGMSRRGRTNGY